MDSADPSKLEASASASWGAGLLHFLVASPPSFSIFWKDLPTSFCISRASFLVSRAMSAKLRSSLSEASSPSFPTSSSASLTLSRASSISPIPLLTSLVSVVRSRRAPATISVFLPLGQREYAPKSVPIGRGSGGPLFVRRDRIDSLFCGESPAVQRRFLLGCIGCRRR